MALDSVKESNIGPRGQRVRLTFGVVMLAVPAAFGVFLFSFFPIETYEKKERDRVEAEAGLPTL